MVPHNHAARLDDQLEIAGEGNFIELTMHKTTLDISYVLLSEALLYLNTADAPRPARSATTTMVLVF